MAEQTWWRVAITGLGVLAPNGDGYESFRAAIFQGRSGLRPLTGVPTVGLSTRLGGEFHDGLPPSKQADRTLALALAAAAEALARSGLDIARLDRSRFAVVMGTCLGGIRSAQRWMRRDDADGRYGRLAAYSRMSQTIGDRYGLYGPRVTFSTACAAGTNAIGYGLELIRSGCADFALVGGADALAELSLAGFHALEALSPVPCAPYSNRRSGIILGEGAGVLVLERLDHALARRAPLVAELCGYGLAADAFHPVSPHREGRGVAQAMQAALLDAAIPLTEVDYINGHGTGTDLNDPAETMAIKTVFGAHAYALAVSSTKSMIGHLLGASGAVEGVTLAMAMEAQTLPPTVNWSGPDAQCDLDYVPNVARPHPIRFALSNSLAFGGCNAVVACGRLDREAAQPCTRTAPPPQRVVITGLGALTPAGAGMDAAWQAVRNNHAVLAPPRGFSMEKPRGAMVGEFEDARVLEGGRWETILSRREARRLDPIGRLAVVAARMAMQDAGLSGVDEAEAILPTAAAGDGASPGSLPSSPISPSRLGVVFGTSRGPIDSILRFYRPVTEHGYAAASPACFPNTVYNAAPGHVSLLCGVRGPSSTITQGGASSSIALAYARDLIARGAADAILVIGAEELHESVLSLDATLGLIGEGPPRPFDVARCGMAPSMAGVAMVVESASFARARHARIHGEIAGCGMTVAEDAEGPFDAVRGDAQAEIHAASAHLARSADLGFENAMRLALRDASLAPSAIGWCGAQASGLPSDAAELAALRRVFASAPGLAVSSPKGCLGETGGAAGLLAAMVGLVAMREAMVPPTAHLATPLDEPGPLELIRGKAIPRNIDAFLVNATGNGAYVTLAFRRFIP